jgi:cytoskeletal protein RodZ
MPEPSEQQFPDQDLPGGSTESTSGSPSTAGPAGNRPADGAPVMRPDEMTSDDWEAGDDAQDFLGLQGQGGTDPQPTTSEELQQESGLETASALADAPELEDGAFENWLEDESEDSASWLMELDEQSSDDAFDPDRLESEFGIQPSATAASRGGWILRVTLVAAGLGAGFVGARWYGNQQLRSGGDTPVAQVQTQTNTNTGGNTKPTGNAQTTSGTTTPETTTPVTTTPEAAATGTQATSTGTNTGTNTNTGDATTETTPQPVVDTTNTTGGSGTELTPDPFFPTHPGGQGEVTTGPTQPDTGEVATTTPKIDNGKTFTMPVEDMVVVPRVESPIKFANEEDLAAVWLQREIPLDQITNEERMLTPQVGRVRLVIHGGEIFEGRLYAVGENKVWLDTGLGKMALLGWQVDRIEHLSEQVGATLGGKGSEDLAGLKRVRVRTPGGVFYGKLLDQNEGTVTLITEDGGRLRLANARVEPAGKSRTRIVDPGKAQAKEAASKSDD